MGIARIANNRIKNESNRWPMLPPQKPGGPRSVPVSFCTYLQIINALRGRILIATVRFRRVSRAIHLTHSARANLLDDFMGAQTLPARERHSVLPKLPRSIALFGIFEIHRCDRVVECTLLAT